MTLKRRKGLGRESDGMLVVLEHRSQILKGTLLGDPHPRKLGD
jgi:hypothetical protein